jgi:thiol:disulfide interchange protein DsbD
VYLPVRITPPASLEAGTRALLRARVSWLMCKKVCVPGHKDVALSVPVSAQPPQPNQGVAAAIAEMSMPGPAAGWKLAASHGATAVTLDVAAPHDMHALHFYQLDQFLDLSQPQTIARHGKRAMIKMVLDPDETVAPDARLRGVLAYTDAHGDYRGIKGDIPFSSRAVAAKVSAMDAGGVGDSGLGGHISVGVLLLALLGGLILNLMPCVFPVLGIKVVGFVEQAGKDRRRIAAHAWAFTFGVVLSFWVLAGALALLRAGGTQLGWGFQLQSPIFVFLLAVVILVFALNLSGVFEIGVRATSVGSRWQSRQGIGGSFLTGVLATVVATPCSAPFLAPALGAALILPGAQSFAVFTAIALGLSVPYLVLATFPSLVRLLPRPGPWMQTFKQLMAFPLYATLGYLIWVLAAQTRDYGLLYALLALSLAALALWIYGRFATFAGSRARRGVVSATALILLVLAIGLGWPRATAPDAVKWQPWSPERVAALRREGTGVYVDFTARWCATCQVNKKVVFGSSKVRDYFRDHDIVALKADWTTSDPRITRALAKYGRSAVPFNLVYPPGSRTAEPVVLPEVLTPRIVLDAFDKSPIPAPGP